MQSAAIHSPLPGSPDRFTARAKGDRTMLLSGFNHVATMTSDTDRLHAFYRDIFDATIGDFEEKGDGFRLTFIDVGPGIELNVFQKDGNTEAERQTPMFGRGRIDHI